MSAMFDTLEYARELEDAGFSRRQAEVQAKALARAVEGRLATKADITDVKGDIVAAKNELTSEIAAVKHELAAVKSELTADIAAVKSELTADIAAVKADLRETELRLQKEIQKQVSDSEMRLLKWQWGIAFALAAIMAKGFGWLGF